MTPECELIDLISAAARLQEQWQGDGVQFCFIGGLAVQHWGEPRKTNDVDVSVWTEFGNERPVIEKLLENLKPRIANATDFALVNRVVLAEESEGVSVDISLAAFPFELDVISRATEKAYGNKAMLRICGASDLVILKAFANRPRDWQDIRGILIRSEAVLDWDLIDAELTVLAKLKEEPEILVQLARLREETSQNS